MRPHCPVFEGHSISEASSAKVQDTFSGNDWQSTQGPACRVRAVDVVCDCYGVLHASNLPDSPVLIHYPTIST